MCVASGADKELYYEALCRLQEEDAMSSKDIAVYEDAEYAIQTALDAGFYTICCL